MVKKLSFLLFLILPFAAWCFPPTSYAPSDLLREEWETYKLKFGKNYESKAEDELRLRVFAERKRLVANHNQRFYEGGESHLIEINFFSDQLPHEWVKFKGLRRDVQEGRKDSDYEGATFIGLHDDISLPSSMDWRTKGAVTPVKDQGQCGSCWAFAATGSLEGQHFRQSGSLVSLSEQNLVDCVVSEDGDRENCNGGSIEDAFSYIIKNHGIDTEKSYPYFAQNGKCHFNKTTIGATEKGFVSIPENNEKKLLQAVASVGPVAVAIDASLDSFMYYKKGVYHDSKCSSTALDHGVLVVGYGTENGLDYWLVKNSWGKSWGVNGYIKMARNKHNLCGIATLASYPLV